MRENDRIIVGLINHSLSQEQLASIATKAVKEGDIFLAELAFAQIENQDAILKLYKGRLLSLKGDFKNFIEFYYIFVYLNIFLTIFQSIRHEAENAFSFLLSE